MKIISILAIGLLILSFMQVSADGAPVSIEIKCPSSAEVGSLFDVELWIHPNGNEVGWWYIQEIHWTAIRAKATGDPSRGGYKGNASLIGYEWQPNLLGGVPIWTNGTIDNGNGTIITVQSMCSGDSVCPVTEESLLCTIPFRALYEGTCYFYINQTEGVDLVGTLAGPGLPYTIETVSMLIGEEPPTDDDDDTGDDDDSGSPPSDDDDFVPPTDDDDDVEPPVGVPPNASASGPYSGLQGEVIQFDATKSTDDGVISLCEWVFGDGSSEIGATVNHIYTEPGNYTVVLSVYDNDGLYDIDTTYAIIGEYVSDDDDDTPPLTDDDDDDTEPPDTNETEEEKVQIPLSIVVVIIIIIVIASLMVRNKYKKKR